MPRYVVALLVAAGVAMTALVGLVHGDLTLVLIIGASAANGMVAYNALPHKKNGLQSL
jgi:mannose/fructose/N-acetylgalactosamine-specific phosphotransferase system component IIC